MDEILMSEVIIVLLEKEDGVTCEEFAGLFHQVHGYQLTLANHGYKCLTDLLHDMKDNIELLSVNGQLLVKYRPPCQHNVISPCTLLENEPYMSETCSATSNTCWPQLRDIPLDEFPKGQPSCSLNAPNISCHTSDSRNYLASEVSSNNDTYHTIKKMPSKEIVKIISNKMKMHPTGVRAAKLRQYIREYHKIDLELYSQQLGFTDMLSMLKQIPNLTILNTLGKNIIIATYFHKNLCKGQRTPSAKADPSSTSRSTPSIKHSVQPDVPRNRTKASKTSPSQENDPSISETCTASSCEPCLKTDNLFPRCTDHTHPISCHKDSTPTTLLTDGNSLKKTSLNTTQHIPKTHQKQVPRIPAVNGDVSIASDTHTSKAQPVQVKEMKFSEKLMVDFLKAFPFGIKIETLRKHLKNKYKIDLIKYSQKKGSTDIVSFLQSVPGITVVNKRIIFASDVYKKSNSTSNATGKSTPAKCVKNSGTGVIKKTPQDRGATSKPGTTRLTRTAQQISSPHQISSTNAVISRAQYGEPGLRPNVSYASACASNLRKDQMNAHVLQCPPSFKVQKVQAAKATLPIPKAVSIDVLPCSKIKDNLQVLLKSHAKGLSIFHLKKLYLMKFQQPLAWKGLSARKLLMDMKDIVRIKGVGVQMKVHPVISEDPTSQRTAALVAKDGQNNEVLIHRQTSSPLSTVNSIDHIKHVVPRPLSKLQPSSSGCNHTELTGGYIPHSSSDTQWPPLLHKSNILKEIKQRVKMPEQKHENTPKNELCKQIPAATCQPQRKDNSPQILLEANQGPYKVNGNIDYTQQEPQTSHLAHRVPQSGFNFVMEETGFCFVMEKPNLDMDTRSNTYAPPLQLNQSVNCNMAPLINGSGPEANIKSVNVFTEQKKTDLNSKEMAQQGKNHPVASAMTETICSVQKHKTNDTPSQQNPNIYHNTNVKSLLAEPKTQRATSPFLQTDLESLQAHGKQFRCDTGQIISMPSTAKQEVPSSESICDFGQRGSENPKQEMAESKQDMRGICGLAVSPKPQSPKETLNSKTKTGVETQHIPKRKSQTGEQAISVGQASSPGFLIQEKKTINPSVNTKSSTTSPMLHKEIESNNANGHIGLETQRIKTNLATRDDADGATTPPLIQQKTNTGHVNAHSQMVTDLFQIQPIVSHANTGSQVQQSGSSPGEHQYSNCTADRTSEQEKRFTSKSYEHISHSLHGVTPMLSGFPITSCNQNNSSEENPKTWQTDSEQRCCIL